MNIKCISTDITVFGSGLSYKSSVSDLITIGNVYETDGSFGDRYFKITCDYGKMISEFPTYIFEKTNEPVTENPNRDKEQQTLFDEQKKLIEERQQRQFQQLISDNMERFYNPENFQKIQEKRSKNRETLSKIFVGGLPYDNY